MMTSRSSKTEPINIATEPEKRRDSNVGKLKYGEGKSRGKKKKRGLQGPHIRVRGKIQCIFIPA